MKGFRNGRTDVGEDLTGELLADLTLAERVGLYNRSEFGERYPDSRLALTANGRGFQGTWFLGQNYRSTTKYYGAYPPSYLPRVMTMFPDAGIYLHGFSGSLPSSPRYVRLDRRRPADVVGDAQKLPAVFVETRFRLQMFDPPYSKGDAVRYDCTMPDRRKVLRGAAEISVPGGFVVWLDTVWPQVARERLEKVGVIAIYRSSNHRVRSAFFFRRPG